MPAQSHPVWGHQAESRSGSGSGPGPGPGPGPGAEAGAGSGSATFPSQKNTDTVRRRTAKRIISRDTIREYQAASRSQSVNLSALDRFLDPPSSSSGSMTARPMTYSAPLMLPSTSSTYRALIWNRDNGVITNRHNIQSYGTLRPESRMQNIYGVQQTERIRYAELPRVQREDVVLHGAILYPTLPTEQQIAQTQRYQARQRARTQNLVSAESPHFSVTSKQPDPDYIKEARLLQSKRRAYGCTAANEDTYCRLFLDPPSAPHTARTRHAWNRDRDFDIIRNQAKPTYTPHTTTTTKSDT